MKTKAEILLKRMSMMYKNIVNLNIGFQQASNNPSNLDIAIDIYDEEGNKTKLKINSFQQLQQEFTRIDNNFKKLTTSPSYMLESDGTMSKYEKTTFMNAEYLENFVFDGTQCIVDKNSVVEDLVFPTVKLPITLNSNILKTEIFCRVYTITNGYNEIPDVCKELNLEYLQSIGKIGYTVYNRTIKIEKQQVNYFGRFTVESVTPVPKLSNSFLCILSDIKYTSKSTIGDTIDLKIGDFLVSETGASKYKIVDIDKFMKQVKIERVGGIETPKVGVNSLFFNSLIASDINVVNVPIKPDKKLVIFLSTENPVAISYPSVGIKIDTSDYKVMLDDKTYTIDEYFQKYVTNFSEYLNSLMIDTSIPYSLGIKPNKPILEQNNFKCVQINKHLIDAKTQSEMNDLNKKKQQIQNDIDYKQTVIDQTQNEVDTLKFNSIEDKNYRLNKITQLRNEINTLKQNMLTVTRDIDSNATKYGLKSSSPKYKVIGFWEMQDPMYSPLTAAQHIIRYDVQYRYLSKDVDTTESTTYKMISNGKEVTVAFSNWIELNTRTLNKTTDINGDLQWEQPLLDSVDDININQLSITINEGESLEIKVRAVTEAGFPVSPLKSAWSESLRIDFPNDLKNNNLQATVTQNNIDLNKAEFQAILQNLGLLTHVSGTIKESEKTFLHSSKDIASGQYTAEQKNIPLDVALKNIMNDINILKQTDTASNINVSFVDFDGESYTVTNNSTLEVSAGNYSDEFNVLDTVTWGNIIRKRGYLKIRNNNSVPVEIKTLVPGTTINSVNAETYYNVPAIIGDNSVQVAKQVVYFRNIDLVGQVQGADNTFRLVVPKAPTDNTAPESKYIDNSAADKDKNLVMLTGSTVSICKLIASNTASNFLCFTTEHPSYNYDNKQIILTEMQRLGRMNPNLKASQYQSETVQSGDEEFIGFKDNDKFAVGRYTCGAWLYPYVVKPQTIQVVGNTTVSTLIINKESEILIPIIYEYRMVDRLGHINGEINYDISSGLVYSKKLGIDILINNSTFKFDLKVTSKFKSKITTIDTRNVSSVVGQYNGEARENLS